MARGPYAKGKAKRAQILDTALKVVAEHGYSGATVKELADAVGLSQNGLLHYFGSKDNLFLQILQHRDVVNTCEVEVPVRDSAESLSRDILDAVDSAIASPGMTQLTLRVTGEATEPTHIAHDFLRQRYDTIRGLVDDALSRLQANGRLAPTVDPTAVASLIWAAWDGLQVQWMYDKTTDVRARMAYLLQALGIGEETTTTTTEGAES